MVDWLKPQLSFAVAGTMLVQLSATLPVTPPTAVVEMVVVLELPCTTLMGVGAAAMVKSRASTMTSICCECISEPLAAGTLKRLEPPGVEANVVSVSVECAPATLGVTDAGEKPQVAPAGSPVQLSATAEAKPLVVVSVTS